MLFSLVFNIDKDVITIYYHKNVKFFCQNLVNIALKRGRCIGQSKKHYLILKMAIIDPKDRLLFIFFSDLHPMIGIGQVKLSKTLSPAQSI